MDAKGMIRQQLHLAQLTTTMLLDGLTDADMLVRIVPGANHAAWQFGHLISSERSLIEAVKPGSMPALPEGFAENHSPKNAGSDDASKFLTKAEYQRLLDEQRRATLAVLDALDPADFDKPSPGRMNQIAPNFGAIFVLVGGHEVMHSAQLTPLRRKLGKPVAF